MLKRAAIVVMILSVATIAFAADSATIISRGNSLFRQKKYSEAIRLYEQALGDVRDPQAVHYNIGAAQFRLGEYAYAVVSFEKSLATADRALERKANYNLGNAKFKLGVSKEDSDLSGAVELVEQSLAAYKRAIELGKNNDDVRLNYELAEKKLKELKAKSQQDKQPEKQNRQQNEQAGEGQPQGGADKEQQEAKKENSKDQQYSSQEQGQQSASGEKPQEQNQQEAKAKAQEAADKKSAQTQEEDRKGQSGEEENVKEISGQEAGMLLDDFRQEENSLGKIDDTRKAQPQEVSKDW